MSEKEVSFKNIYNYVSYSPRARKKLISSPRLYGETMTFRDVRKSASGFGLNRLNRSKKSVDRCAIVTPKTLGNIDLDLRRTKTKGTHPDATRAMSVVLRVSIPSRTSALEKLAVGNAERVGTGRQAYSRLMDDKRVIYYHELPTGTPRHRQRHYHLAFLSLRRSSSVFFPTTHRPLSFRSPVAALQTTPFLLPSLFLPVIPPSSPSCPSCELYSKEDPSP